ncbi:MAG TPA: T9SS type A sorting domain-containing protein [Candidatus Eisenbacteria bacterium]
MRTESSCTGPTSSAGHWCFRFAALALLLFASSPASASHVNIVVDGNLNDLISVVNANPGGANGGFSAVDPLGDVYTPTCGYVNGYDIRDTYAFFDFRDGAGEPTPHDVTLYLGWVVEGLVGDVDGDGNPDTFSTASPGGSTGCAISDEVGIGPNESYNLLFDLDCTGEVGDVRVAVLNNMVGRFNGTTFQPLPGATFAMSGHNLEVRIPNYQNLLQGLNLTGIDLCDAQVRMTANAEFDGPGEDFVSPPFQLEVPPQVSIGKFPPTQVVCSGQNPEWRVVVNNIGMCQLNEITVTDTLQSGMTFVSSVPPSTGTSQFRTWQFNDIDLAPGDSVVITLAATFGDQCPAGPLTNTVAVEAVHTSTCLEQPLSVSARDTGTAACRSACLTVRAVDSTLGGCPGSDVTAGFYIRNCGTVDAINLGVTTSCGDMSPVDVSTIPTILGAGDSALVQVTCRLPATCDPAGDYTIRLDGTANIADLECTDQASASAEVDCAAPCLQVEFNRAPAAACAGDTFAVVFDVRNCSPSTTETVTLTGFCNNVMPVLSVTPPSLVLGPNTQQEVTVRCIMPAECQGDISVRLNASTSVGPGTPGCTAEANQSHTVACLDVCLSATAPNDTTICPGETFLGTFTLRNCNLNTASLRGLVRPVGSRTALGVPAGQHYVLTATCNGTPVTVTPSTVDLAAGAKANVTVSCNMPAECGGPLDIDLKAVAWLLEDPTCRDSTTVDVSVDCAASCVDVVECPPISACPGETAQVPFVIRNCSKETNETVTVSATCNGTPVVLPITSYTIAAGDSVTVTVPCVMPEVCAGNLNVRLTANSHRAGSPSNICPDTDVANCTVTCGTICVAVNNPAPLEGCPGDTIDVPFTVSNCGTVAVNVNMVAACNGQVVNTVNPFNFDLNPGQSRTSTVTCVIPDTCEPGEFLTVVNSAWARSATGCAMDIAGNTRITCLDCPTLPVCGPLALNAPPADTTCPDNTFQFTFTVENQGEPDVDVYLRTSATGWTFNTPVINNLATGNPITVTATRSSPPANPEQVVIRATSYLATSTPADTAGEACDFRTDTVNIVLGSPPCVTVSNPTAIEACPGDTVDVAFTVSNCGIVAFNVNMVGSCNGQIVNTVDPFNFNLSPGQSRISTVTCVVPDDAETGEFLTVVNSAWARTAAGCAFDVAGNTRINIGQCPVSAQCGPLALNAPPADTTCPDNTFQFTFTVENQGEPNVDVYLRTSATGWTFNTPVINNLATGNPITVTAIRSSPPANPEQVVIRATSYLATTTPADTAGEACDFRTDTVNILFGTTPCVSVNNPTPVEACAGATVQLPFTVTNCGTVAFNVNMVAACNGQVVNTVTPFNFNLNPGQSQTSTVTCTVPADCKPGEFLTVVNSAWARTAAGCQMDIAGTTRINCVQCPVGGSCGPLALVAPPSDSTCPGQPVQFTFTVENQGEAAVDVYLKSPGSGWNLSSTVVNNLASGNPVQVTASRASPPASPLQLTLRATSYPASSTPADTAGFACATASDVVSILTDACAVPLAEACPRTIGFWRQQTQQKPNGSRKICEDDPGDGNDMLRLWREVIASTDVVAFKRNDGSMATTANMRNLGDDDLFDALGCELEGPRPMTQRDMAEIQYLALMLNVSMGLLDHDTPVNNSSFHGTVGDAIDTIEEMLNHSGSSNGQMSLAGGIADAINNGSGVLGIPCAGGENGPFAGFGQSCPSDNAGFVCPDGESASSLNLTSSVPARQLSLSATPNPFNPTALLHWTVGPDKVGQHAVIDIFDAAGRPVAHLFDGSVTAESNEVLLAPDGWSSGMYIARLTVGNESIVYRLMLVK